MRLLVLHGPNLPLLGVRDGVPGGTLSDLDAALRARARELGVELEVLQSNHEGVLLDTLAEQREAVDGVIVNPAGLFGSYALKEALEAVGLPAIEVMLRPPARESVVAEACVLQVHGATGGFDPYLQALETFASGLFTPGPSKTLGRKKAPVVAPAPAKGAGKSLGRAPAKSTEKAPLALVPSKAPAKGPGASVKTLGRVAPPPEKADAEPRPTKTLGRGARGGAATTSDLLTRALVRQKVSERLSGTLGDEALAAWARTRYEAVQRGAPAEQGQRELLEESLLRLTLSHLPATRLSDEQLVDLMTRLDEG
ncbi:type II 3-dehydroquinate dehydratase [Myxococcus sp. K15C18031901]|uniref:type II 3-dehydroquinate dehydratase n=1 Tax=Myxococcus dinghuensis TaxID=2906761 RepID=UPI0020A77DD4|nr:type II 3-dehydroquinate dehydratase [Myxococcus dinghuensis]MCP3101988.1 type II 3-dehydroquinate dehydratase [Myxococcus dinghuensis]